MEDLSISQPIMHDHSIEVLCLSTLTKNALLHIGVNTINDLLNLSYRDLLKAPLIGKKGREQIMLWCRETKLKPLREWEPLK